LLMFSSRIRAGNYNEDCLAFHEDIDCEWVCGANWLG
jgi:hypothetical protein